MYHLLITIEVDVGLCCNKKNVDFPKSNFIFIKLFNTRNTKGQNVPGMYVKTALF